MCTANRILCGTVAAHDGRTEYSASAADDRFVADGRWKRRHADVVTRLPTREPVEPCAFHVEIEKERARDNPFGPKPLTRRASSTIKTI